MTIEDAIKHCMDTALSNAGNAIAYLKGGQKMLAESCEKCAAEHEQLAEWLKELKQRRNAERWIPCSERLPEIDEDVIVYYPYWDDKPIQVAHLNYDKLTYELSDGEFNLPVSAVTHWMPLPEPPEKE